MNIRPGAVIIYRSAAALVTGSADGKISIRTASGDTRNIREKDIVFLLHPGPAQTLPAPAAPVLTSEETAALMEGESLSFDEFTELAFGSRTPDAAFGAWKLLEERIWFERNGSAVSLRPREAVEETLRIRREKIEAEERHRALLERIRTASVLPEDRPYLSEIEQVALGIHSSSRLMRELGIEAVPEKAHKLLLRTGVWDPFRDPFPERAGYPSSDPVMELPPEDPAEERRELDMPAWAIDDEDSRDPDDAISWQDGVLYVHVADPAASIRFGDEADREARTRGENLYMPEKTVHMLPPRATEQFGLGLSPVSPALTFAIRFTEEGIPRLDGFFLSRLAVRRLTYETAGEILARPELEGLHAALEKFRAFRAEHGALFLRLPEVKIRFDGTEIRFKPCPVTPEREFVAGAMLAAGYAAARYAADREIPMPFVCQEPPDPPAEPGETLPAMYAMRRSCRPGTTGTIPGLHAGLGLDPYLRVTSPLRRYSDLLAHYQFRRLLKGVEPLSADEIEEALRVSEEAAKTARKLERTIREYWTLLHFQRNRDAVRTDAVCVFRQDDRAFFLLPEFAYEYRTRQRSAKPGEVFSAAVLASDPPSFTLRLKMTRGEEQFEASGEKEES